MRTTTKISFVATLALSSLVACSSSSSNGTPTDAPDSGKTGALDGGGSSPDDGGKAAADIVDTAVAAGSFQTLVAAVQAAGLENTLRSPGPFTVLAPTDTAFGKLPAGLVTNLTTAPYKTELGLILKYHVISGEVKAADLLGKKANPASVEGGKLSIDGTSGKVIINGGSTVTTPDVLASNGVIHVIDSVLLPTIVDTASGYDDGTTKFSSLVSSVVAADLATLLSGPGTFTVFAPSDAAFEALKAKLGATAYNAIVSDKAKLTKILKYHVLTQTVFAKDVASGSVPTAEGTSLTVTVAGGKVTLADSTTDTANVVLTDLPNSNGVIHVIDKVLVPADL